MLDQNTDRMWYVIGAVIIGAAIILILNGTAPQLFASVGDTFQEKVADVTQVINKGFAEDDNEMTDGAGPVAPNANLIPDSGDIKLWAYEAQPVTYDGNGWTRIALPTQAVEYGSGTMINVSPNTEYTQSMIIKTDAEVMNPKISFFWPLHDHVFVKTTAVEIEEDVWKVTGTGFTESEQHKMRVPDIYVDFDGGTYAEFGQFKLEKGSVATPYVE